MGRSLLDILSRVGTVEDELHPLVEFREEVYSPKYLSLRAGQGELPAVRRKREWQTSKRAIRLYIEEVGRKKN